MTYDQLCRELLYPSDKVKVIVDGDYRFISTVRWCRAIYTTNFCNYHNITFEVTL
uniref:Uncharacterized protein n=1 Tax=Podoviridae sp. ctaNW81 TaxID=2826562 RepID=A0A8S5M5W2_9CAUD|nr:MAG TPA: hypothetical protein [Podoviridae sp. ctaNW81]